MEERIVPMDLLEEDNVLHTDGFVQQGGLRRALRKHHITGIAISGAIGIGVFINSGEIIALAGGPGAVIAYVVAGSIVVSVMLCLSEMVSIKPCAGALFDFPAQYYDNALAFASGWAYWLAYTCSCCTLTVQTAEILEYWNVSVVGGIFICLVPIALVNIAWSVLFYGWVEWTFKWLKQLFVLFLFVFMIVIANGGYGSNFSELPPDVQIKPPSSNWNWTPGLCFTGWSHCLSNTQNTPSGDYLQGSFGTFMGIWTSITLASFAYIGVEIVIVTAGEARYPRNDLPIASRWISGFAWIVYALLSIAASLNVPYNDHLLVSYGADSSSNIPSGSHDPDYFRGANDTSITTGIRSPFIISMVRAGYSEGFQTFVQVCLFFAALTAANTAFYVSSRTFYVLTTTMNVSWIRDRARKTSFNQFPLHAVCFTVVLSIFSFLAVIPDKQNQIVGVVSRISVTSIFCVYIAECVTYCRYLAGMKRQNDPRNDRAFFKKYQLYRSPGHQPLPAIYAIVSCSLLLIFNGWETFYQAHHHRLSPGEIAAGLIRAYFGPLFFLTLYLGYKHYKKTSLRDYSMFPTLSAGLFDARDGYGEFPLPYKSWWRQLLSEMR